MPRKAILANDFAPEVEARLEALGYTDAEERRKIIEAFLSVLAKDPAMVAMVENDRMLPGG
jgi:hypothetical protein